MILGGMNFVIKDSSLKASIGVVLAGVWMAVFMLPSLSGVKEREAKLERSPDQTLLDITVKELWKSTKTMWTDYPEAFKYLFGHAFAKSGIQTILIINVTYFNQQMSLTGFQILIISVTVLFNGTFSAWAFSKFAKKFSTKKIWIFLESFWIVTILLTVLFMHKKGDLFMAILIGGGMYGFGLSWYFSVSYQGFDAMVPRNKATQFAGLFYFVGLCVSTLAPAIYSAVVQYTNNQRYALVTLIPWNFLGLITFMFIDFEKGKKTAGRF